jgi:Protease inhibitor Inh
MRFLQVASVLTVSLALAGCTRTLNDGVAPAPAPLAPQPVSPVQSGTLPDPSTSTSMSQFPAPPSTNTQVASAGNMANDAAAAASALDVTKESMVGNWKVAGAAGNCNMFLTLTNLGSGSRGGTRGCVGELKAMGSWEVAGKQVLVKDRDGNVLGKFYKTADARFDGSTASGQALSLSR